MPVRNVVRVSVADTHYHVYNRGHNKDLLFIDQEDYEFFQFLLQRCFGSEQLKSHDGRAFPWFGDRVRLNAFCLMPNHFHLLLYQGEDEASLSKAMQSLATTYSMYFNKKHDRRGSVFESVFKSSIIMGDIYLQHITRYIHLNAKNYKQWEHSSYSDYQKIQSRAWVDTQPILELFDNRQQYLDFIDDYTELHDQLSQLKHQLADYGQTYHTI